MKEMMSGALRWCLASIQSDAVVSEHVRALEWFGQSTLMDAEVSEHVRTLA
jgi:hypothetical protein